MIDLAQMTSPEIGAAIERGYTTVVFAVGSNEQHGPCLPVSTDTVLGDALALSVAESLGDALKAPTINVGCSEHHMRFPGTITLSKETLQRVVREHVDSLSRHGFKRIVVLPSHGGNFEPLEEIGEELGRSHPGVKVVVYSDLQGFVGVLMKTSGRLGVSPEASGAHAGESEVSMMMWIKEDLVRTERIPDAGGYLGGFDEETAQRIFEHGIGALSPNGVLGDPADASGDHGRAYIEDLTSAIVEHINLQ
jgi:creatinine amidohydrolase